MTALTIIIIITALAGVLVASFAFKGSVLVFKDSVGFGGLAALVGALGTVTAAITALHSFITSIRQRRFQRFAQAYGTIADAWGGLKWWTSIERAITENRALVKQWIQLEGEDLRRRQEDHEKHLDQCHSRCLVNRLPFRRCPLRRLIRNKNACITMTSNEWQVLLKYHRDAADSYKSRICHSCAPPLLAALEKNKDDADSLDRAKHLFGHLEDKLNYVSQISRPTDPSQLILWLQKRHHRLSELNSALLDILPERFRRENAVPDCPDMTKARSAWLHAVHNAKAETSQWPSLAGIIEMIDVLADYWWALASMDPLYRHPDPNTRDERIRAYRQAEEAVSDLETVVATRRLGVNWFRLLILRIVHDPLNIEAMNRVNRQI